MIADLMAVNVILQTSNFAVRGAPVSRRSLTAAALLAKTGIACAAVRGRVCVGGYTTTWRF
jgi:hypothetical protein